MTDIFACSMAKKSSSVFCDIKVRESCMKLIAIKPSLCYAD